MTNKIAVFCTEGLVLDALLEHWQESEVLSAYSPVLVSEDLVGETALFKQRPIAFHSLGSLDAKDFSLVIVIEAEQASLSWLQQLSCTVLWACQSESVPSLDKLHTVPNAEVLVLQALIGSEACNVVGTVLLPASIHGKQGVEALASQTVSLLSAQPIKRNVFNRQLSFNAYPLDKQLYQDNIRQQLVGCEIDLALIQVSVFHGMGMQLQLDFKSAAIASERLNDWQQNALLSLSEPLSKVSIYQATQLESVVQLANIQQVGNAQSCVSLWVSFDDVQIFVNQGLISTAEFLLKPEL